MFSLCSQKIHQFNLRSSCLLTAPLCFDFQLLLCERFEKFVALQVLFLLVAQHKDIVVVVIVVGEMTARLIDRALNLVVVDLVLTELIDFTNQLCCH